jgi:hypothetical protein
VADVRVRNDRPADESNFAGGGEPAVFVSAAVHLAEGRAGGTQLCTREYRDTLRAARFALRTVPFDPDRRPLTRLQRALGRRPYQGLLPAGLADRIVAEARGARAVFLNQVDLTPLAKDLRRRLAADCRLVLLSHGLESVDFLHLLRTRTGDRPFAGVTGREERVLGRCLMDEARHRPHLDAVVCLSAFEVEIERWLGSQRVGWVPRVVTADPLDWHPMIGRAGFVGTLDHPPNREGLELFLAALSESGVAADVRVRVVGGPAAIGENLARRHPAVDYLGPLSDPDLRAEAATWCCFAHPLFCYARGASTKLAIGLGWEIPVVTTPEGCRGYEWRSGELALARSPAEFAARVRRLNDPAEQSAAQASVRAVVASSPDLAAAAARLRQILDADPPLTERSNPVSPGGSRARATAGNDGRSDWGRACG